MTPDESEARGLPAFPISFGPTSLVFAGPWTGLALAAAGAAGIAYGSRWGVLFNPLYPGAVLVLLASAWLLLTWLRWRSIQLIVREGDLTYCSGISTTSRKVVQVSRMVGVNLTQSFAERMVGVGTVVIETTGSEEVTCRDMAEAPAIVRLITVLMDLHQSDRSKASGAARSDAAA